MAPTEAPNDGAFGATDGPTSPTTTPRSAIRAVVSSTGSATCAPNQRSRLVGVASTTSPRPDLSAPTRRSTSAMPAAATATATKWISVAR